MSALRDLDPSSSVLAFFGAELRRLRTAAGVSQEELGQRITYSGSLVGMIETARRAPTRDFAERCDDSLVTGGVLARLWPLVSQEALPRWFRPFAEIERTATSIRSWEPLVIPGLLQTEAYARALITAWQPGDGPEAVQLQVTARMERQQLLDRVAEHPKIIVQVVPLDAGAHPGLEGPLVLVARRGEPDVAYLEVQGRGQLVETSEEVARYGLLYDLLRAVALPPDASREMIAGLAKGDPH